MTTNTPMVVWKASKHPDICKAFMKTLYDEDTYVEFLHATPVGMLPAIKGIADTDATGMTTPSGSLRMRRKC